MFGPNAVGKSNFIAALDLAKRLVIVGTPAETPIEHHPFRLNSENKKKDTTFVFRILCNSKNYEYGFSYNAEQISREWLYILTRKTQYTVFERSAEHGDYNLSHLLKLNPREEEQQFLTFFAKATPARQLFLHEVISRNLGDNVSDIDDLNAVKNWFIDTLKVLFPDTPYKQGGMLKAVTDEKLKEGFSELLRYFGTGIDGIDLKDVEFEKLGIPLILDLIQGEKVFFIDEMERSLHPSLMINLMHLFYKYSNNISTQLFFTTHESTLMNQALLRRDEIWLMEKTDKGVSSFQRLDQKFSLTASTN